VSTVLARNDDQARVHGPDALRRVRRRFITASGAGALLATVLFVVVMQSGRSGILDNDLLGGFYDGQARAILEGHLDVDPTVAGFEGFRIGDETHIYQGIVPAVARVPILGVLDGLEGRLTGVSLVLAFAFATAWLVAASWRIRRLLRGDAPLGWLEATCTAVATFGMAVAPLLFLASRAWVYHEALAWGTALSLGSLTHLLYWLTGRPSVRRGSAFQLAAAVLLGALALNTRPSVGIGPIAALALTGALLILAVATAAVGESNSSVIRAGRRLTAWMPARSRRSSAFAAILVALGLMSGLALYAGINHARFGSLFGVPLDRQALVATDRTRQEALAANGNSLFGAQYAPSVVAQILRPGAIGLSSQFPFLGFPASRPGVVGAAVFAERDWSSSVPSSQPLMFIGSVLGVSVLVAPRRLLGRRSRAARRVAAGATETIAAAGKLGVPAAVDLDGAVEDICGPQDDERRAIAALRIVVVGAAVGGSTIIVFGYMAQRYLADLFPLLALTAMVGWHSTAAALGELEPSRSSRRVVAAISSLVMATTLWTVWAHTGLALQYNREIAPGPSEERRVQWVRTQLRWGSGFDVLRVPPRQHLPLGEPVGRVAVVGECEAVYRSNGSIWYRLESAEPAGRAKVMIRRTEDHTAAVVIARSGDDAAAAELLLEPLGGDFARFVVAREGMQPEGLGRTVPGPPVRLPHGEWLPVELTLDWRTGEALVRDLENGAELLNVLIDLPPERIEPSGGTPVETRPLRGETPLCDDLVG
jgi:hypothetical protein